jgi:hypothetical protein
MDMTKQAIDPVATALHQDVCDKLVTNRRVQILEREEHQNQHLVETSSGNYNRFLLWMAIFATNLRFENPKSVEFFYRIMFFIVGVIAFHSFCTWYAAKRRGRPAGLQGIEPLSSRARRGASGA